MIGTNHKCAASLVALCLLPCNGMAQETRAVRAPEIETASQVSGLSIVKRTHLPPFSGDKGDRDDFCANHLITAKTPAGKAAEQQGWGVTGEVPIGPFQAVSFVGTFEAGTSGTCKLLNGNVGLFSGEHLVAIVYGDKESNQTIGHITPFGDQHLRIWDGELLRFPVADMRSVGSSGIVVTPPALEEKVCHSKGTVPAIHGLPIDMARRMLAESGWKPADMSAAGTRSLGMAEDIAKHGIVEVEDCSGTGFGFCLYQYEGPAGSLVVTTAGQIEADGTMPTVVSYSVACQVEAASEPITENNWMNHPEIAEVRSLYQKIKESKDVGNLNRMERQFEDCEPYEDNVRSLYMDRNGKPRIYYYDGGSEDSFVKRELYYDESGKLRFAFIVASAVNGTQLEHRVYFSEEGKKIWEIQKRLHGPGYTFPTEWPDAELIHNPVQAFNDWSPCTEVQ